MIAEHQEQRVTGTTGLPAPRESRGSLVDPYEATLRDYLARYPDISVVRLAHADQEGLSHLHFLGRILGEPAARSRQRAIERRIREAKFRENKTLTPFESYYVLCHRVYQTCFG